MKPNNLNRISAILVVVFLFFSCSSDLDFDQVNDFKLEPAYVANLAYFDLPAKLFYDNGSEQRFASDVKEFDAFKQKFFKDNLVKAELDFELENTITRAFTLDILLLNDSNKVLQILTYTIPAYSGNPNVIKFPTEVFENQRLNLLKQTTQIGFVVRMAAGPPLNASSLGNFKLRSSANVYMKIE
jgi:hypothetical protein